MARTNVRVKQKTTTNHEGVVVPMIRNPLIELRRAVLTCLLWENQFYETGDSIGSRISELVKQCKPDDVVALGIEARDKMYLRHVPLFLAVQLWECNQPAAAEALLIQCLQRADEITEVVSMWWKPGRRMLPNSMKRVLRKCFTGRFSEKQLAKYHSNQSGQSVKLRDVMFLARPKPVGEEQKLLFKKIADDKLTLPDGWERAIMEAGKDGKDAEWKRLLEEGKLGDFAFLRNLRNLSNAGVDNKTLSMNIAERAFERIMPFRFVAAARVMPQLEDALDKAMLKACAELPKLSGKTVILVDNSPSMYHAMSGKSDMQMIDAACAFAAIAREVCDDVEVWSFSNEQAIVPSRRGMALIDAIKRAVPSNGTLLGAAVTEVRNRKYDRLIVITDEQSQDRVPMPSNKGYMVNVATYGKSVAYSEWVSISGWSEHLLTYILAIESEK